MNLFKQYRIIYLIFYTIAQSYQIQLIYYVSDVDIYVQKMAWHIFQFERKATILKLIKDIYTNDN